MAAGVAAARRPPAAVPAGLAGWRHRAACAGDDRNMTVMFPPDGRNTKARAAAEAAAKKICNGSHSRTDPRPPCPVRAQCLATALYHGEEHGVWGGMTAEERTRLGPPGRLTAADALAAAGRMLGGVW